MDRKGPLPPIADDAAEFIRGYVADLTRAWSSVDLARVCAIVEVLWNVYQEDRQIFFLGNGGSAASASHIATDLTKGALGHRGDLPARPVRALSLTDNLPLLSAWANDAGFESVFVGPLRTYLRKGDVVVGISVSGNSENVLRAARFARDLGAIVIGLTGAGGGKLAGLSDLGIVVDSAHYGVVEDVHMHLGHLICYYFRHRIEASLRVGATGDDLVERSVGPGS